jgi:hypothetical protein
MSLSCHHCGAETTLGEPIPREATCESCGRDLHACRQCRHFDLRYNNSCRETMADPVEDKDRRNFCEYFSFSPEPFRAGAKDREAAARAKLEGLFGSSGGPRSAGNARAKLESLFRKPKPAPEE